MLYISLYYNSKIIPNVNLGIYMLMGFKIHNGPYSVRGARASKLNSEELEW